MNESTLITLSKNEKEEWFLNLSKSKKQSESPTNKILDPTTGKKFKTKESLQEHIHNHFTKIFKHKKQ